MIAMVAPWDSIGFQILTVWMLLIILVCWIGRRRARNEERLHHEAELRRWRAQRDAEVIPLRRNMDRNRRPAA